MTSARMMHSTTITKHHLDALILHLDKYMPLVTCNLVDYFTKSLYQTILDDEIRKELINVDYENVLDMIFNEDRAKTKTKLTEYVNTCKSYSLYNISNVCMNIMEIHDKLKEFGCKDIFGLRLNVFVKPKKSHEIEILSAIASSVHNVCKTSHLVDVGDGKGYLSSMLALHHKIKVLGIDSSITNTKNAVKRVQKLQKVWHGITKDASSRSVLTKSEERLSPNATLYKQITQHINDDVDLRSLISDIFLETCSDLGIVGLHTCGNLGTASLELFVKNSYIKSICNISCCYHLLTESEDNTDSYVGFPMSDYLRRKNFKLGKNARMLSSQSIDRIICDKRVPRNSIFYRAILQVIIQKYCKDVTVDNVGKLKNFDKFLDYYRAAMKRINLRLDLTDEEIEEFSKSFECKREELNVFTLIRYMLAPAIESIILLDRLLYLQEQCITNAYLVKLFDPVISPRCYGIIAIKN